MKKIGILFLSDTCFNNPLNYAKQVLKGIIESGIKIKFMTNLVPIKGIFDDEFFSLYKKAGGIYFTLGSESLSDAMLNNYNKAYRYKDILECSRLLNKHRIPFQIDMLIGGPGESIETVKESMSRLKDIHFSLCLYTMGIRIEPNTKTAATAFEERKFNNQTDLLFPNYYFSDNLDFNWTNDYIKKSVKKYSYRFAKMAPVAFKHFIAKKIR